MSADSGLTITPALDFMGMRELGLDAVFTISSAKPGNGVEQIRDNNLDTYWQSDGAVPHVITVHFMEKKTVSHVCIYCDYNIDESYSFKKLLIRSGTTAHDVVDVASAELSEPVGWVTLELKDPQDPTAFLRTHMLQIKIMSMHQNGRDTHVRQVKLLGPRSDPIVMAGTELHRFKTTEMLQYAQIR